jgi:hypothetical protein
MDANLLLWLLSAALLGCGAGFVVAAVVPRPGRNRPR